MLTVGDSDLCIAELKLRARGHYRLVEADARYEGSIGRTMILKQDAAGASG